MKGRHGAHTRTHYLKPGEMYVASEPSLITTVLGSCISVTMFDRATGFSIISHAVMPRRSHARKKAQDGSDVFQFVDSSIRWMISQFEKKGIKPSSLEVKMFGGATMFPAKSDTQSDLGVGKKNIETASDILRAHGVKLMAWNVGGNQGRKIIFNTQNGEVLAKFITRTAIIEEIPEGKR
jgi:chemotaxis protein CheD